MIHHQHHAGEILPGDAVTYEPHPAPGYPARATIYVLTVDERDHRVHVRAVAFSHSSWPHLYVDRIDLDHPLTITRPQWATMGEGMMSHIINPAAGETTTWCEGESAVPVGAPDMGRRPVCRSCGYRAAKDIAAATEPFTYRIPAGDTPGDDAPGAS